MKVKITILTLFLIFLALLLFPSPSIKTIELEYGQSLSSIDTASLFTYFVKPETIEFDTQDLKPEIGSYPVQLTYSIGPFERQDLIQVQVKDMTAPKIKQIQKEITIQINDTNHDFLQYFKISDKSDTNVELNLDSIDYNKAGSYTCSIQATDTSNNESTLDFTVRVIEPMSEKKIQSILSKYDGTIEIYYKNLTTNAEYLYNDTSMYPCSIIKMCVLFAMYHQDFIDIDSCRSTMEEMMIYSSNDAYNELLTKLGKGSGIKGLNYVNDYLKSIGINKTELHHALRPSSSYFQDGKRNFTSPSDIGKLLEMLYRNELFSSQDTKEIINLMSKCADTSAIATGLPKTTTFAHKSGWADDYYLDGGIIYGKQDDYILVIFTKGVSKRQACYKDISSYFYSLS